MIHVGFVKLANLEQDNICDRHAAYKCRGRRGAFFFCPVRSTRIQYTFTLLTRGISKETAIA